MRQTISLKTLYVIHVLPVFKLEIQCLNVLCFFVEYMQNIQERFSPSLKRHSHTPIPTEPSQTELDSASTTLTQIT
jgi:hypothetical protein